MTYKNAKRPSLDTLVRDLYGSLSEEMRFEHTLHRLGEAFRSNVTSLHSEDFGTRRGSISFVGSMSAADFLDYARSYNTRWGAENLWMHRSLEQFQRRGYAHGEDTVSDSELLASPFYRHMLRPIDIRHGLAVQLWGDDKLNMAVAAFHRGHGERGFDGEDLARIAAMRPHLVNAYAIYRRLAQQEDANASLRACFERAPLGMLLLDGEGRLLESNAVGDELLSAGVVRQTREKSLVFSTTSMQRRFQEAIKRFGDPLATPCSLPLECADGGQPARRLALHLCAAPGSSLGNLHLHTRVIAFIVDLQPSQTDTLAQAMLQQVLDLSPTEARAALALREQGDAILAAQALGLTLGTVRTHLKHIHAKLGLRRNGELLRIVERLLGSAPTSV